MPRFEKSNRFSNGRPPGARNKSAQWLDELGDAGTEKVIRVVREHAESGNMHAAAILLGRTWPLRRGRAVRLDLPPVETTAGLVGAQAAVIAAMSRGELTPDEAASVASVLETQRRAIETNDLERRVRDLEQDSGEEADPPAAGTFS